ncbi:CapA family protein, partial [bacterium]|nr:CapA family protein [candidate division CSSED10-310 bacterium]
MSVWLRGLGFVFIMISVLSSVVLADAIIENFEPPWQGDRISSYSIQEDQEPNGWQFDPSHGANGTTSCLRLYGNTWKLYDISDVSVFIDPDTIWEVYVYSPVHGTVQGFGLTDGENEIIYSLEAYSTPQSSDPWITAYTGWKSTASSFQRFKLPVGEDWFDRFDSAESVNISHLIFVNDEDGASGDVYFDQISDITESEPQPPHADLGEDIFTSPGNQVEFTCTIIDPDSTVFDFKWDFGDGMTSNLAQPIHTFYEPSIYNVLCEISDETGLVGQASIHVYVGETDNPVISILLSGDCMFARRYEDANEDGIPGNNDGSLILPGDNGLGARNIAHHTRCFYSDARVSNLESPLTDEGWQHPTKSIRFRSRPDAVAGVTENNVDLVCLANNHLIDYMDPGVAETLVVLDNPIAYSSYARNKPPGHFGGGNDRNQASLPSTIAIKGLRVGFVGLCSITGHPSNEQPFFHAGYEKPGVVYLNSANLKRCLNKVNAIADISVVVFHGGEEYSPTPSSYIESLAYEAIDNGADIVVCHHPHVSQGIAFYNGKPIIYSLGNFIFDQRYQHTTLTYQAEMKVDRDGVCGLTIIPVHIEQYEPKYEFGNTGNLLIRRLMTLSEFLGTTIIPVTGINRGFVAFPETTIQDFHNTENIPSATTYRSYAQSYFSGSIHIPDNQYLYSVNSITGVGFGSKSVLLGRDLMVFGNFEDDDIDEDYREGSGWEVPNTTSAGISDYNPYAGETCLRLRRSYSNTQPVEVQSRWRIPIDDTQYYMLSGYYR